VKLKLDQRFLEQLQAELGLSEIPPKLLDPYDERIRKALIDAHGPEAARIFDEGPVFGNNDWWDLW